MGQTPTRPELSPRKSSGSRDSTPQRPASVVVWASCNEGTPPPTNGGQRGGGAQTPPGNAPGSAKPSPARVVQIQLPPKPGEGGAAEEGPANGDGLEDEGGAAGEGLKWWEGGRGGGEGREGGGEAAGGGVCHSGASPGMGHDLSETMMSYGGGVGAELSLVLSGGGAVLYWGLVLSGCWVSDNNAFSSTFLPAPLPGLRA